MNRITLVDYIGYCDSKGEVTGHTAKTLKETKEMLSDSYDVSMVVTPPYAQFFDDSCIARQRAIRDYNIGMLTAERRGIEAGREEGENRINQLNIELSKRGRTEDILKAAVDKEYQEKLLKEFEL